LDSSI